MAASVRAYAGHVDLNISKFNFLLELSFPGGKTGTCGVAAHRAEHSARTEPKYIST